MRDYFERRGIDLDRFAMEIPEELHKTIHHQWNNEWRNFMNANPRASGEEVFRKMHDMMEEFGLSEDIIKYPRSTR